MKKEEFKEKLKKIFPLKKELKDFLEIEAPVVFVSGESYKDLYEEFKDLDEDIADVYLYDSRISDAEVKELIKVDKRKLVFCLETPNRLEYTFDPGIFRSHI